MNNSYKESSEKKHGIIKMLNETGNATPNDDSAEKENSETSSQLENILKSGSVVAKSATESIYCLTIIGQVEGHYALGEGQKTTKYEQVIPLLVSIEENEDVDGILVVLNTMGGDVEAGLAISEMIASMSKPTVSLVLGGGHSIGVPLAVSAKKSFIVESATMTIHPVRMSGLVVGVPQTFNYFNAMQKRIVNFICNHSKAKKEKVHELMMRPDMLATDVGSIITGKEAVEYGIIDEIGGLDSSIKELRDMIKETKKNNKTKHDSNSDNIEGKCNETTAKEDNTGEPVEQKV